MAERDYSNTVGEASLHAIDYLQIIRNRWKEIFLTFLLVFVAAAVVTYLLPPSYRATVEFQINSPGTMTDPLKTPGGTMLAKQDSENYKATQFEVITSSETLKLVVKQLGLTKEWGGISEEAAVAMLKGMVDVEQLRGTDMAVVTVRGGDPKLVQGIAEAVMQAYASRRAMEDTEIVQKMLLRLKETQQQARDNLTEKSHDLRRIIQEGNYVGTDIWSASSEIRPTTVFDEENAHRESIEQLRKFETDIASLKSHIEGIKKLPDDQLLGYVISADLLNADGIGTTSLRDMYKDYQGRVRDREALIGSGYGPKHVRVISVDQTIVATRENLNQGLVGLRTSLVKKLELLEGEYKALQEKSEKAKQDLLKKTLLDNDLMEAKRAYSDALDQLRQIETSYISESKALRTPRPPISIHEHASTPSSPYSPKVSVNLAIGAVAGIMLGLILAFLLEYFDTSVKTVEEVERSLGIPVIGVVPKDIGFFYNQQSESPDVEAYRILRTNIELTKKGLNEVAIAFVSGTAGEGKTTTLCNLAYVYAQAGYTTLMVDADMRRSKLNKHFDLDNSYGLSNYLTSDDGLENVVMETAMENLYILPAGPPPRDPSGLLSSRRMAELIREAKNRFDVVLIDSPPILGVSDSAIIVRLVDLTVMVVQPRKLSEKILKKEKDVIENSGGNLIGAVLNNVDISSDHQYQYYTTYYMYTPGQGSSRSKKEESGSSRPASSGGQSIASNNAKSSHSDGEDLY